jgi:hypothetical protein
MKRRQMGDTLMNEDIPEYDSVEEFFIAKALNLIEPYKTYKIGGEYGFVNPTNNLYVLHNKNSKRTVTEDLVNIK